MWETTSEPTTRTAQIKSKEGLRVRVPGNNWREATPEEIDTYKTPGQKVVVEAPVVEVPAEEVEGVGQTQAPEGDKAPALPYVEGGELGFPTIIEPELKNAQSGETQKIKVNLTFLRDNISEEDLAEGTFRKGKFSLQDLKDLLSADQLAYFEKRD